MQLINHDLNIFWSGFNSLSPSQTLQAFYEDLTLNKIYLSGRDHIINEKTGFSPMHNIAAGTIFTLHPGITSCLHFISSKKEGVQKATPASVTLSITNQKNYRSLTFIQLCSEIGVERALRLIIDYANY